MKEKFMNINFSKESLDQIGSINAVLDDYHKQGYRLSLRQLYYQLVSRNEIVNSERSYKNVGRLVVNGRMTGHIDWNHITDRGRVPHTYYCVDDLGDALEDTRLGYRLDRMSSQDVYIELWCEKDALSDILKRVTYRYGIPLVINKGYSSASAMYEARGRFEGNPREGYILYFGDHDASGLDMVRDIRERTEILISERADRPEIVPCALTMEQIRAHALPPNPTKQSDTRASKYMSEYGQRSWELDALAPQVLVDIAENAISKLIVPELYQGVLDREEVDKKTLGEWISER